MTINFSPNTLNVNATTNSSTMLGPPPSVNIPSVIFLSILIPLICAGNLIVCIVFIKYQRLRTATNCFLFSLAISDLAVGTIIIPFWITFVLVSFNISQRLLKLYTLLDITCSVASMANLASVSMERWYGVTYPFRHMRISCQKATVMALCSWFYGFCTSLLYLSETAWVYSMINVFGLCLPFLIIVVCYCGIARKIRQKSPVGSTQSGRENKTIRTLLLVTFFYFICWLPFIVGSIIANHCEECAIYVMNRPFLRTFPKLLHYFNSCVNPILYALLSPAFKSAYKQFFFGVTLTRSNGRAGPRQHRLSMEPSNTGTSVIRKSNIIFIEKDRVDNVSLNSNNNKAVLVSPDRESHV